MSDQKSRSPALVLLRSRRWLFLPPIAFGVIVVVWLASSKEEVPRRTAEENAIPVRVVSVQRESIGAQATGYGTVKAKRVWKAIAEVGGRVVALHEPLRPGIHVNQQELLVEIDATDYELAKKQRIADLNQNRSELEQLDLNEAADRKSLEIQRELERVRTEDVTRLRSLRGSSAASANELDVAIAVLLAQKQTILELESGLTLYPSRKQSVQARVASAEAKLAEIERDLERTKVRAPFAGLISNTTIEVGQYLSPGQEVLRLLDVSSVEIETQFSLEQLLRLFPQQWDESSPAVNLDDQFQSIASQLTATVVVRSGDSSLTYSARPLRIADQVNPETRTLGIVVEVSNETANGDIPPSGLSPFSLRPGMFCEVILESRRRMDCVVVDRSTLTGNSVFVVENTPTGPRMKRQTVRMSKSSGSDVMVHDGLGDGDLVIVNPPLVGTDGVLVKPIFTDPEAPVAFSNDTQNGKTMEVQR